MLTKCITSQCDHGGYLLTTPKLTGELTSSSSISLAGQTRESLARMNTPLCLPSFLALPLFLPILSLHSPSTRGTTKRNGVSNLTVTATSLPDAKPSKLQYSQAHGAWAPACVSISTLQQKERQQQRAYRKRPTALETPEKNDRDTCTLITGNSLSVHISRVVDSRQNLDANQSN